MVKSTLKVFDLDPMGKVLTTLTVTNRIDQALAKQGKIPIDQIRTLVL